MNEPAFPIYIQHTAGGAIEIDKKGISIRDYFATHATEEDIRLNQVRDDQGVRILSREAARYRFADSMLEARKSQK